MKCNYKRNQNESVPRWVLKNVDGKIKEVQTSEEKYLKAWFEQFGVEIVTPKEKLITALKNGDYVIGVDYNPFVLQDVFHYKNGVFEFIKFSDISTQAIHPLRLRREQSILLPADSPLGVEVFLAGMAHYDDFIVSRKDNLLDIGSIPPSLVESMQEQIENDDR